MSHPGAAVDEKTSANQAIDQGDVGSNQDLESRFTGT
jgi:hypothetical protein